MNRFKREIRKKGIKLESDFQYLPYYIKGEFGKPGCIFVDSVTVNAEKATVTTVFNVDVTRIKMLRNGNLIDLEEYPEEGMV